MKIANIFAKVAIAGLFTAAVLVASPAKADAQVSFGVHVGVPVYGRRPVYVAPVYGGYYRPGFYGGYGYDRHLAWERHEQWDRFHRGFYR